MDDSLVSVGLVHNNKMTRTVFALSILQYLIIFAFANTSNSLNSILFNGHYEFFDLSYPFDNKTIYWPKVQPFEYIKKTEEFLEDGTWYSAKEFAAGEHGGTHIDAPYHFSPTGATVGSIPLEKLIVPLIIVDISSRVNDDPEFVLHKHHLDYMINDNFGEPCVLIFKFGWSKFFGDKKKFLGIDETTNILKFPGLSKEVAEWITTSYKNVVGIGVDLASVDPGSSTDYAAHKTFAAAGLYNIENVNLNQRMPEHGCTAFVMPMKIAEGTGAPLRLVAICPK